MAQFEMIKPALNKGRSVRRDEWEPLTRMFVSGDTLMCQCGLSTPWRHSLSWNELDASDWKVFENLPAIQERSTHPADQPKISRLSKSAQTLGTLAREIRPSSFLYCILQKGWIAELLEERSRRL
jgi:hypothetical protein